MNRTRRLSPKSQKAREQEETATACQSSVLMAQEYWDHFNYVGTEQRDDSFTNYGPSNWVTFPVMNEMPSTTALPIATSGIPIATGISRIICVIGTLPIWDLPIVVAIINRQLIWNAIV